MRLIGVGCKQRSGKTTVANIIKGYSNKEVAIISFGEALKQECMDWLGANMVEFSRSNFYGSTKDKLQPLRIQVKSLENSPLAGLLTCGSVSFRYDWCKNCIVITPREFMQYYGTDYRRKQDANYWVGIVDLAIQDKFLEGVKLVIVDDIRFPNEANLINDNFVATRLVIVNRTLPDSDTTGTNHASEVGLDNYDDIDITLDNSGTIEDLAEVVESELGPFIRSALRG
jgi:hypothetical protein